MLIGRHLAELKIKPESLLIILWMQLNLHYHHHRNTPASARLHVRNVGTVFFCCYFWFWEWKQFIQTAANCGGATRGDDYKYKRVRQSSNKGKKFDWQSPLCSRPSCRCSVSMSQWNHSSHYCNWFPVQSLWWRLYRSDAFPPIKLAAQGCFGLGPVN